MGVNRIREDSLKEKKVQKTRQQLQKENEELSAQVTDLQLALCDVYEIIMGGTDNG